MGKVIRVIHFDWSLGIEGPGVRTGVDVETCLKLNVVTSELKFRGCHSYRAEACRLVTSAG